MNDVTNMNFIDKKANIKRGRNKEDINILARAFVCVRVCAYVRVYTLQVVLIELQLVDFSFRLFSLLFLV